MASSPLVQTLAPNVIRVTHFKPNEEPPPDRPWLKDILLPLPEAEKHGSEISFEVENGLVIAKDQKHEYFFQGGGPGAGQPPEEPAVFLF